MIARGRLPSGPPPSPRPLWRAGGHSMAAPVPPAGSPPAASACPGRSGPLRGSSMAARGSPPRSGRSGTLAGILHSSRLLRLGRPTWPKASFSLSSGRRRRYHALRNGPGSLGCAPTPGLQRARLSSSSRGRAQAWVVWPPGRADLQSDLRPGACLNAMGRPRRGYRVRSDGRGQERRLMQVSRYGVMAPWTAARRAGREKWRQNESHLERRTDSFMWAPAEV